MGLLSEEIPSFEELINENELPPLNLKLMLDRVSSLPLYDRLNIDKGSFCEKETKLMQLQAEEYNDKINNLIKDKELGTKTDDFIELESEYLKSEESLDLFLKHFYNCLDNDELIKRIQRNMTFDEVLQESTDEVPCNNEFEPYTPSKEFLQFFLNANNGKYDNLFIPEPSHDLSSDFDSDDEVEIREEKIKELSHKLKFSNSSNSKFLEPIINANKPNAFEILPECSNKIPTLKKEDLFLSDSESENDLKTKNLVFAVDKTSDKVLQYQTKNGVKVLKKKKEKCDTTDSKRHLKNNVEPKSGVKKSNANIQRNHSNNPTLDQHKISLDNVTTSAAGTNVVGSPKLLTNTNENVKKGIIKKQMKNETSSSGDEDWEGLAQKNLLLRSKNLEQKATKKK